MDQVMFESITNRQLAFPEGKHQVCAEKLQKELRRLLRVSNCIRPFQFVANGGFDGEFLKKERSYLDKLQESVDMTLEIYKPRCEGRIVSRRQALYCSLRSLSHYTSYDGWDRVYVLFGRYKALLHKFLRANAQSHTGAEAKWKRDLYLEALVRDVMLNHYPPCIGPVLFVLILWSGYSIPRFCQEHRIDQHQLFRLIEGHGVISMSRLRSIFDNFRFEEEAKSRRKSYEMLLYEGPTLRKMCNEGPLSGWALYPRDDPETKDGSGTETDDDRREIEDLIRELYDHNGRYKRVNDICRNTDYSRSFVLRVLRGDEDTSFHVFSKIATISGYYIVPREIHYEGTQRDEDESNVQESSLSEVLGG